MEEDPASIIESLSTLHLHSWYSPPSLVGFGNKFEYGLYAFYNDSDIYLKYSNYVFINVRGIKTLT